MFYTKNITIPPAGEQEILNAGGCAVVGFRIGQYTAGNEPALRFDDESNPNQPLLTGSVYSKKCGFDRIVISGTAESAGDSAILLISDSFMEQKISFESLSDIRVKCGKTFDKIADDTVKEIEDLEIIDPAGNLPNAVYLSCLDGDINYAFDELPTQGVNATGHTLTAGSNLVKVEGLDFIQKFRFISAVSGSTSKISITPEY